MCHFMRNQGALSTVTAPSHVPTSNWQASNFSTLPTTRGLSCLGSCHPSGCELASPCGFDLCVLTLVLWRCFHVFIGHLDFIFGEMSIQAIFLVFNWVDCIFEIEMEVKKILLQLGFTKIFFRNTWVSFHTYDSVLWCRKNFIFDEVQLIFS